MSVFEFVLIPMAIILGLGITELLSGVVRVLRGDLKAGPLHLVWVFLVFLVQVQWMWAQWALHEMSEWTFPVFGLGLMEPIGLYMGAAILFPAESSPKPLDEHLLAHRRSFFPIAAGTLAVFLASDWVHGDEPGIGEIVPRVVGILFCGILATTGNRKFHWTAVTILLVLLAWYIYAFTFRVG